VLLADAAAALLDDRRLDDAAKLLRAARRAALRDLAARDLAAQEASSADAVDGVVGSRGRANGGGDPREVYGALVLAAQARVAVVLGEGFSLANVDLA